MDALRAQNSSWSCSKPEYQLQGKPSGDSDPQATSEKQEVAGFPALALRLRPKDQTGSDQSRTCKFLHIRWKITQIPICNLSTKKPDRIGSDRTTPEHSRCPMVAQLNCHRPDETGSHQIKLDCLSSKCSVEDKTLSDHQPGLCQLGPYQIKPDQTIPILTRLMEDKTPTTLHHTQPDT